MSNTQTSNEVTDRTNEVLENNVQKNNNSENIVSESQVSVVNDDPQEQTNDDESQLPVVHKEKQSYEVVFFARYAANLRPSADEITDIFNHYGVVHHVNCPEGRNYAFVFMSSLNTTEEHRRTRSTINQIIQDMTPETRFHLTVASSNRGSQSQPTRRYSNYYRGFQSQQQQPRQYRNYGNRYGYRSSDRSYDGNTGRINDNNTVRQGDGYPRVRYPKYTGYQDYRRPYFLSTGTDESQPVEQNQNFQRQERPVQPRPERPVQPRRSAPGNHKMYEPSFGRGTPVRGPASTQNSVRRNQHL